MESVLQERNQLGLTSPRHVTAESACYSRVVKSWKTAKEPGGAAAAAEGSRPGCGICVALAAAQLSTNSQSSLQAQLLSFNQGKSEVAIM